LAGNDLQIPRIRGGMKYAGIGSRKTPPEILDKMRALGQILGCREFVLRSGAAQGADSAFEAGCDVVEGEKEIFVPWKGFNNHPSPLYNITPDALKLAEEVYGPRWQNLKQGAKKLMARNCYQILGQTLDDPVDFVICWTQDGCESEAERGRSSGGTGQAIALAARHNIPVFNLYNGIEGLLTFLFTNYEELLR
jgi:hypothetical protein